MSKANDENQNNNTETTRPLRPKISLSNAKPLKISDKSGILAAEEDSITREVNLIKHDEGAHQALIEDIVKVKLSANIMHELSKLKLEVEPKHTNKKGHNINFNEEADVKSFDNEGKPAIIAETSSKKEFLKTGAAPNLERNKTPSLSAKYHAKKLIEKEFLNSKEGKTFEASEREYYTSNSSSPLSYKMRKEREGQNH